MKKLIIWAALLCLLLTACAQLSDSERMHETQPTTNSAVKWPTDIQGDDHPLLTFSDIDSYKRFVEMVELPENFVPYEQLEAFGEFRILVFLSRGIDQYHAADYSKYLYEFVDEKGNVLALYVGQEPIEWNIVEPQYCGDMRDVDLSTYERQASIVHNGLWYRYTGNNLKSIVWETNGVPFTLVSDVEGGDFYPKDGPLTFVQELLHTDTNKAAMESFKTALNTPAVK